MNFLCSWLTHRLTEIQRFPNGSVKTRCKRCKGIFCLNHKYEVFVPWTDVIDQHYVEMTGARTWL